MIRELMHDSDFLSLPSEKADATDSGIAEDLKDTFLSHRETCVGMAANMIGERKRIIVLENDGEVMLMFNPVILKQSGAYEAQEGCLSLLGAPRKCKRFRSVKVQWQNEKMQIRIKNFTGWTAEIIQHEIDHCNGILI